LRAQVSQPDGRFAHSRSARWPDRWATRR
jgi:hypothetical protein